MNDDDMQEMNDNLFQLRFEVDKINDNLEDIKEILSDTRREQLSFIKPNQDIFEKSILHKIAQYLQCIKSGINHIGFWVFIACAIWVIRIWNS